ncbi:hypothetical protein [Arthrobacter oryzae]|uniref:hypothetical protein n=1 Tax=Arthrobacter oryzae TaxID=409290 RepID=UPI00285E51AB|nr:hypothetical protein [Arthrobacter oryzae]MDR6508900.1 hypothetical protein [Arthrobacter oryzae]
MADRAPNRAVLLLAGTLMVAGLAGCEYADDVGADPSRGASRTGSGVASAVPLPSVDPEREAELGRNMAALELALVEVPIGLGGAAGGISGQGNSEGGLEFTTSVTETATYKITAVCIGSPHATLSVRSPSSNALLEFTTPCAEVFSRDVELRPGPLTVRLVAVGDGHLRAAGGVMRISDAAASSSAQP